MPRRIIELGGRGGPVSDRNLSQGKEEKEGVPSRGLGIY